MTKYSPRWNRWSRSEIQLSPNIFVKKEIYQSQEYSENHNYSRQALFLMHALAHLIKKSGVAYMPPYIEGEQLKEQVGEGGKFFFPVGEILRHETDEDKKSIQVLDGRVGVYISIEGKPIHILTLGRGAIIGGNEISKMADILGVPPSLINLKVERAFVENEQGFFQHQHRLNKMSFGDLVAQLGELDPNISPFLSNRFSLLKKKYPKDLKYGMTLANIFNLSSGNKDDDLSLFSDQIKGFCRQYSYPEANLLEGVHLTYTKGGDEKDYFNENVLIPELAHKIKELCQFISNEEFLEIGGRVSAYMKERYQGRRINQQLLIEEGEVFSMDFELRELISLARFKANQVGSVDLTDVIPYGMTLVKFMLVSQKYRTESLLMTYAESRQIDISDISSELIGAGFLEGQMSSLELTPEGMQMAQENMNAIDFNEACLFSLNYFISEKNWFFSLALLSDLKELGIAYLRQHFELAEVLKINLFQVPHSTLSPQMQGEGLSRLGEVYVDKPNILKQIKYKEVLLSHSEQNYEKTVRLARGYIENYPLNPIDEMAKSEFIHLVYIYIEALAAQKKWQEMAEVLDNGHCFPYYPEFDPAGHLDEEEWQKKANAYQEEKDIWGYFVAKRAEIMSNSKTPELSQKALLAADELEKKLPKDLSHLNPLTAVQLVLSVQRLYGMAYVAVPPEKRMEISRKMIDLVSRLNIEEVDQNLIQPLYSNTAIAYRRLKDYKNALIYHEKAATDKRGECRQLTDSSFILDLCLNEVNYLFEKGESPQIELREKIELLIYIFEFLSIERSLTTTALKKSIEGLIIKINQVLNEGDYDDLVQLKDQINIHAQHAIYSLNDLAINKIKTSGLSGESSTAMANCFDAMIKMQAIVAHHTSKQGKTGAEYKEFKDKIDLLFIGGLCLKLDDVLMTNFMPEFFRYPPWPTILAEYLILHRLKLIDWLEQKKYTYTKPHEIGEKQKIEDLLYQLKVNLIRYESIVEEDYDRDESRLWPQGWPDEFEDYDEIFSDFKEEIEIYRSNY